MKQKINIVWLKRDLRTQDHQPFYEAENSKFPYLVIYLFEPTFISYQDTSERHLQFIYHSLLQLSQDLEANEKSLNIWECEAKICFEYLHENFEIQTVFSYQESGIQLTFERDLFLKKYFKENNIEWREFQKNGTIRGIKDRTNWDKKWYSYMCQTILPNTFSNHKNIAIDNPFPIGEVLKKRLDNYSTKMQPPGEHNAWRYLQSFLAERGNFYSKNISKPHDSRKSCSRLSPYIAWGNLSIRQVFQFTSIKISEGADKRAFQNFTTRLRWHCHFIQKFEMECSYETQCINSGYEALLHHENESDLHAWKTGNTGFPLVDACMRCLQETGWINFRMRAMVVSFLTHNLFQDWRKGVYHLAKLFLDYDPGIHYPQFQMQAGTTGVNTIRIYNPVKNSMEHDAKGMFIKKWLPELKNIPEKVLHEPWKLSEMEQELYGVKIGENYPTPIIDLEESRKFASDKIWGMRKSEEVKKEGKRIVATHVRKKKVKTDKPLQLNL